MSATASGALLLDNLQVIGQTILLRSGARLDLTNGTRLNAEGEKGQIQLEAIRPDGDKSWANIAIENSSLNANTITASADQQMRLRDTILNAGFRGNWGVIDLATAPTYEPSTRDESGDEGGISLERSRLAGKRVLIRSGSVEVIDSEIKAPKGKIHLQANRNEMSIIGSTLDVEVDSVEDLAKSVDRWNLSGVTNTTVNTPSIGLFSSGNILINSSTFNSSQRLTSIKAANPKLLRNQIRLTDTSGIVGMDAAHSVTINDSQITADATDNLAGNILIRSQSLEGKGEIAVKNTQISASGGAGSGDIRLVSGGGISIESSRFLAQSHNSPANPSNPVIPDWPFLFTIDSQAPSGGFTGGEISLTNQASDRPLVLLNSVLRAEQSGEQGPLSTQRLINGEESGGLIDIFDRSDVIQSRFTGGIITLSSKGGLTISGPETLISTTSASAEFSTTASMAPSHCAETSTPPETLKAVLSVQARVVARCTSPKLVPSTLSAMLASRFCGA
jgi:hypothetical protein